MTNLFNLKINSVTTGKVKTDLCIRSSYSKVGRRKVYKLLVGVIIHSTVILKWSVRII